MGYANSRTFAKTTPEQVLKDLVVESLNLLSLKSKEGEEWRDIVNYEGIYQVSNLGRVRRLPCYKLNAANKWYFNHGGILKPQKDNEVYHMYMFYKDGKHKIVSGHRLVAQAFIPNPNNLPDVNHKDGNPGNNCVDNLEWITELDNTRHAIMTHLFKPELKPGMTLGRQVTCIETGQVYPSIAEAVRQTGINAYQIEKSSITGRPTKFGSTFKLAKHITYK